MYTLWKFDPHTNAAARLEHEERRAEAEAYGRPEVEEWGEQVFVVPVTVGSA
jgi:hypothetical protein